MASDVAATTRTSEKVARLSAYLRSLDDDALRVACVFLTGRPFPASDPRTVGTGWAAVQAAVERAAGVEPGAFGAAYDRSSDPGRAAYELLAERDARRAARGVGGGAAPVAGPGGGSGPAASEPGRAGAGARAEAGAGAGVGNGAEGGLGAEVGVRAWPGVGTGPGSGAGHGVESRAVAAPGRGAGPGAGPGAPGPGPTLPEVQEAIDGIVRARRPSARVDQLVALLDRLDPLSAMYVIKVLSGDLRIGLRGGLLEAAIAAAFGRPLETVQRAMMATGDIGEVAVLARADRLAEARPAMFRPLLPMLASPARDAAEITERMGLPLWAEDKYDGIRAQLHKLGGEVRIFSRDLHDITGQFPDVADAARPMPWDGILDGELLAMEEGRILPFARLQKRLGRTAPSPAVLAAVPAGYVVFDALALSEGTLVSRRVQPTPAAAARVVEPVPAAAPAAGARAAQPVPAAAPAPTSRDELPATGAGAVARDVQPLLELPLAERRALLESLVLPARITLGHLERPGSVAELDSAFDAARSRGNEGLVVKDPASGYTPGHRGLAWLKLKKALATLDCIVVGVEVGHGKRHGVLSDYTFAVRDDRAGREGQLVTVGKAYSGLTDREIAEMTRWFEAHTLRRMGRYRLVQPTVVVEVAFDRVQPSTRHASGFAMRFPRIARLRPDKQPSEADTLSAVAALARGTGVARRLPADDRG